MPFKKLRSTKSTARKTKWEIRDAEIKNKERSRRGHTDASSKGFYGSRFWTKQREFIKSHDSYCCRACVEDGIFKSHLNKYELYVDHIKPIPPNASWDVFVDMSRVENLQPLCERHNKIKTNQPRVWIKLYPQLLNERTDIEL